MADMIQIRRDTAANWTSADPTLAQGELGIETDTSKVKAGDGSTAWTSLVYLIDAGDYLTASSTNTLTNKTVAFADNTLTGVAGVTATQTLTNKTLAATILSGALTGADQTVSAINLKDYGEVLNAIGSTGGGTQDIDLTLGNVVSATVDTSANTFTFSNFPASGTAGGFVLILTNGGSQTVAWPSSVDWPAATAPTLTAAGIDIIVFQSSDAGTTVYGNLAGAAYA